MTTENTSNEQIRLFELDDEAQPRSFRLALETRQRNLAHIAEIRRQIAARRNAA
ncbi:MAG TPA: hypothetical protein PKV27_06710 [Ilumatobacteraceae bacterium]|nr:hypothetical protein [Ilumatobacteraceae bacterium]